jgi:hypothetical protein
MTTVEPEDRDALRVQMQQAIETFRHMTTLFVQSSGFLIAADGLLFGYGLAQKKAVPLLIASLTVRRCSGLVRLSVHVSRRKRNCRSSRPERMMPQFAEW